MNKLNPIKYIENMISHHPKSISLWITEGIVINGERYIIKEFRLRDGSLYAVIAENKYTPKYFEVKLAPDEETLKDIYKAIEENKLAIEKEVTDRKNEIARVDTAIKANTTKIEQEIADRKSEIARVDKAIAANTAKIDKEIADRESEIERVDQAIEANTEKINQEITDRQNEITRVDNAINANTAKIDKEIQDRKNEITRVDGAIHANTEKINQEITDRTNEINRVDGKLTDLEGKLTTSDGKIAELDKATKDNKAKIDQEIIDRKREIDRVDEATKANKATIDQEIANRRDEINRVDQAVAANTAKINKEISDRQNEISRVDGAINANTAKINKEIQDRKNEITRVDGSINANTEKINQEITDRTNEINRIEGKLTGIQGSIKPIVSDNSGLLAVTNENSQVKLTPKHDGDKSQVLNSPNGTINVVNGTNGTNQKTTVEVNPEKVLTHDNLLTNYGISKTKSGNTTKLGLEYTRVQDGYDLNNLLNGCVRAGKFVNAPNANTWYFVSAYTENMYTIQEAVTLVDNKNTTYRRTKQNGVWGSWREQAGDKSVIDSAISANTTKINQEITDRKNEITRVEGKIPTEIGSSNLLRSTAVNTDNLKLFEKSNSTISVVTKDGHQTYKIVVSANGSGVYFNGNALYYNLIKNRTYTFSFWVLTNKDKPFYYNSLGHIQVINENGDIVGSDKLHQHSNPIYSTKTIKANTWTKVWCTFKATSNSYFKPYFWYLNSGDEIYIYDMMLNEGNIPLSYTPAFEDNIQTSIDTVNLVKGTGSAFVMGYGITNTTWNETKKQTILDFSTPGARRDIADEILPQEDKFFDFKPIKGTTYTQSIMIDTDATFNPNGQAQCSWYTTGSHNKQKAYIKKVGEHSYQVWSTYTWNLENTALRAFDWYNLHNILLFRTTGTYLAFYKPKLTTGNLPSDWSPSHEDIQDKITSVENRLITNLDSLNSMPGTLNAVKLTPGSITGDMITGGRLRSTNGWTVIDLTSGIITFNGSSSYIQHSKNNKIFEIQSLLINGSADVRENMIASFGVRKSDNSSKSGIKFSLYNPVGGKPTAEATINADSFSLLDSKNTPLLSVNGSNTYLGNWNIYGWGDIPLAFVNGGLIAKDVGLEGHTESLKKIIEKLCTKTGITWL